MQIFHKKISASLPYQLFPDKSNSEHTILFFDIETTGLSPDISSIYLIGCCYYQNDTWNLIQFFADDYISEKSMLQQFIDFSKNYTIMIHYNGTNFDIPYLRKKFLHYNMSFSFQSFLQVDLYKKVFPYKKLLNLPNLKQKTIEEFLGLTRLDTYSGKELIETYIQYMKDKFGHKTSVTQDLSILLLHNEEDVTNLIQLTSVMAYSDLMEKVPKHFNVSLLEQKLNIEYSIPNAITKPIELSIPNIAYRAYQSSVQISITCLQGELKYFYPNYKDYYYLPTEDTAIHKSVAEFVDRDYRIKAKASTCYIRKTGLFLPQFHGNLEPSFRFDYKEKNTFIELNHKTLGNQQLWSNYLSNLLPHINQMLKKL